jgi:hypothetical protein
MISKGGVMGSHHTQEEPDDGCGQRGRSGVPVPGGLGVVEAGLIAGLTSAGIPQDQAVAAVLIQRFFTSYLPPVWGWATLAWMRRREYV